MPWHIIKIIKTNINKLYYERIKKKMSVFNLQNVETQIIPSKHVTN
jgi:hypothetical protein